MKSDSCRHKMYWQNLVTPFHRHEAESRISVSRITHVSVLQAGSTSPLDKMLYTGLILSPILHSNEIQMRFSVAFERDLHFPNS